MLRRSNHYGIAGWYALRAARQGMIGVSMTNSSPLVAPTRSRVPMLGTNPIAVAAPAGRFDTFCLDMATSTVPRGRIEVAARRGWSLPVGWAIDADGNPATTPDAALAGSLHPLGGTEETGGYKGYGLALVVELLTGILAGASFGPNVASLFSTHEGPSDLGETFMVIDPTAIDEPGAFEARLEVLIDQLIEAPTAPDAPGPVLIPGAPEAAAERLAAKRGVVIDREHHESLVALGERFGVPLPAAQRAGSPVVMRTRRADICIIGGGILGLATALRLLEARPDAAHRHPREGGDARDAPDGPQQRRRARRPVLPAGLAQGEAVPRGQGGAGALLRGARHPGRADRQARGRHLDETELERFAALKERAIANGVEGLEEVGPERHARDRAARGGHPGALEPGHGHRRLPAGRAGVRGRGAREGRRSSRRRGR